MNPIVTDAQKVYDQAEVAAQKVYDRAEVVSWKAYKKATMPAWKIREETVDAADKAFSVVESAGVKAYEAVAKALSLVGSAASKFRITELAEVVGMSVERVTQILQNHEDRLVAKAHDEIMTLIQKATEAASKVHEEAMDAAKESFTKALEVELNVHREALFKAARAYFDAQFFAQKETLATRPWAPPGDAVRKRLEAEPLNTASVIRE